MPGVPLICNLSNNEHFSTTSTIKQLCEQECECVHEAIHINNIVVGVLGAILLILLVVAITGWVCTYWILMKKLRKSVKNN